MDPDKPKDQANTEEEEKPQAEQEMPKSEGQKPGIEREMPEKEEEKLQAEGEKPQEGQQKPGPEQARPEHEQQKPPAEKKKPKVDPAEVGKAKNVIQFFKKTFSLLKLYPPENPSVAKSIDLFSNQINNFLNEYGELSMEVGEFSFSYKGELVFQDEERRKSLPFLFYKDGLRELSFHKGLDKDELHEFITTISEVADLPPEDADIVNALWERNFLNIRYYSIDEFLDQDIGEPTAEIVPFDVVGFSKGKVKMTPEDEDFFKTSLSLSIQEGREKGEGDYKGEDAGTGFLPGTSVGTVSTDEFPEIESMIAESRRTSHMTELVDLLFELLFHEERDEEFATVTGVLADSHQKVLEKADFSLALSILKKVEELKKAISAKSEEKAKLLGKISDRAVTPESIANLKKIYSEGRITDFDGFFAYLENLGAEAFPVVYAIWEDSKFEFSRQKALAFLKKIGKSDLNSLLNLARGESASLTREILSILTAEGERTEVSQLEDFVNHPDKAIRLDVIHALGKTGDKASNKILLRFLPDSDAEIRTAALKSLKYLGDGATLSYVRQMAIEKDFKEKSRREKEAILKFLASSGSGEMSDFLRSILKKRKIFFPYKTNETRLCAVSALGVMATTEAADILREGTKIRNKAIRQACHRELRKISIGQEQKEERREEPKEERKEEPKKETNEEQGA